MAEHDENPATPRVDRAQARASARGTQSNPTREVEPGEKRYSVEELSENPRLIGSSARAIAGAFHGVTTPKTFTLDEAAKRVREFMERPEERA
jgi:hypothetical protein